MKAIDGGINKTKIKAKGEYDVDNSGEEAFQNNRFSKIFKLWKKLYF